MRLIFEVHKREPSATRPPHRGGFSQVLRQRAGYGASELVVGVLKLSLSAARSTTSTARGIAGGSRGAIRIGSELATQLLAEGRLHPISVKMPNPSCLSASLTRATASLNASGSSMSKPRLVVLGQPSSGHRQKYQRSCSNPESGAAPYSLRSTPPSGGRPYGTYALPSSDTASLNVYVIAGATMPD
jgi:hypothetical protein